MLAGPRQASGKKTSSLRRSGYSPRRVKWNRTHSRWAFRRGRSSTCNRRRRMNTLSWRGAAGRRHEVGLNAEVGRVEHPRRVKGEVGERGCDREERDGQPLPDHAVPLVGPVGRLARIAHIRKIEPPAGLPVPGPEHFPVVTGDPVTNRFQAVYELDQQRFEGKRLLLVSTPLDPADIPWCPAVPDQLRQGLEVAAAGCRVAGVGEVREHPPAGPLADVDEAGGGIAERVDIVPAEPSLDPLPEMPMSMSNPAMNPSCPCSRKRSACAPSTRLVRPPTPYTLRIRNASTPNAVGSSMRRATTRAMWVWPTSWRFRVEDSGEPLARPVRRRVVEHGVCVAADDLYIALRGKPLRRLEVTLKTAVEALSDVERGVAPASDQSGRRRSTMGGARGRSGTSCSPLDWFYLRRLQ